MNNLNDIFFAPSANQELTYEQILEDVQPVSYTHLDVYKRQEQDAAEPDGTPVLFGYFCDLPRIVRFNTALELMERPGTLI